MHMRLNKYIADAGVASRRGADELIKKGKVKINGETVHELGIKIDAGKDVVEVAGSPINIPNQGEKHAVYVALNKPRGYVCTTRRFKGEKNVLDLVTVPQRVFPVGRLDKDSEGLLILTNDGMLADQLTHPRNGHEKEYRVTVGRQVSAADVEKLKRGVREGGELLAAARVQAKGNTLVIVLTEGKKRHIRRMLQTLGYTTTRLVRTRIGKLTLGSLPSGSWKETKRDEIL